MTKLNLPTELLQYMENDKYVFINDFTGWADEDIKLDGFTYISAMEGNGLRAKNGDAFVPQYSTIRRANHIEAQLRSIDRVNNKVNADKQVVLGDYFENLPLVIITSGESLQAFAPMFSDKLELAIFIRDLHLWQATYHREDYAWSRKIEDMISLAKFLYRNNPNKVKSIVDELD